METRLLPPEQMGISLRSLKEGECFIEARGFASECSKIFLKEGVADGGQVKVAAFNGQGSTNVFHETTLVHLVKTTTIEGCTAIFKFAK